MSLLRSTPAGFHSAVDILNLFSVELINETTHTIVQYLLRRGLAVDIDELKEKLEDENVEQNPASIQSAVNLVLFLLNEAARSKATAEDFAKTLKRNTQLSLEISQVIVSHWDSFRDELIAENDRFHLDRLVAFDYKVGVSVASHCSSDLSAPVITVSMSVLSPEGKLSKHTVEMDVAQFQRFAETFDSIAEVVEHL